MWFVWFLFSLFCILKYFNYVTNVRCKSFTNLAGKIVLITGGNSGLGLELAKNVASRGATIIIADKTDATETVKKLIDKSNNPNIFYEFVDLASFKSVRTFAEEFKKKYSQLNVLVNNAGVGHGFGKTDDGLESIMQINYFSHFLLTHLLLDILIKTPKSRIVSTSSVAAYCPDLNKENLKSYYNNKYFTFWEQLYSYCNSKAALALMSRTLAEKLKGRGVTTNVNHPGLIRTNIFPSLPNKSIVTLIIKYGAWFFGNDIDKGVQTMLYLVTSEEVQATSGKFFMECTAVWQPPIVHNDELRQAVWRLSEEYVKLKPEEKVDNILRKISNIQ